MFSKLYNSYTTCVSSTLHVHVLYIRSIQTFLPLGPLSSSPPPAPALPIPHDVLVSKPVLRRLALCHSIVMAGGLQHIPHQVAEKHLEIDATKLDFGTAKLLPEERSEIVGDLCTILYSLPPTGVSIIPPVLSTAAVSIYERYEALYHLQLFLLAQLPYPVCVVEQPTGTLFMDTETSCPVVSVKDISQAILTATPHGNNQYKLFSMVLDHLSSMLSVPCDSCNLIGCEDVQWLMEATVGEESVCLTLLSEYVANFDGGKRFVNDYKF